jgi:hypothetical protein
MILAVSFGVTVVVTRLYLSLTGYPQIGHGEFHLAHELWGGLLLMTAATLQLLWSNAWVMTAAAVCAGAGSGLFVDEVGKFITARNDYLTPLAAPITAARSPAADTGGVGGVRAACAAPAGAPSDPGVRRNPAGAGFPGRAGGVRRTRLRRYPIAGVARR